MTLSEVAAEAPDLSNPIINSPYEPPQQHFEIGPHGPTGALKPGRRPSESFIPLPPSRKTRQKHVQEALDFDITGERREVNSLVNDIRREVERWRANNWTGVTPYTRKLLAHWAPGPHREDPVLFCQREAVETAIFLAEVAGRHGTTDYRRRLEPENRMHSDGLPRVALKMATGSGKTVVMAMLIAWQTVNKVMTPRDARFAKRFLIVAPGITIRDRLGVLQPERDDNYYDERNLVPPDLWEVVLQANVKVVNYHTFLPRDAKEIKGVNANTRKLLRGNRPPGDADAFQETPDMVADRVLGAFGSTEGGLVVFNDEAHHCYQDKLLEHPEDVADKSDKERNREARVWFRGLQDVSRRTSVKTVYDLSATPYYLKGSGYNEGHIFPWVVSDFSLMDAIESGIVKIPRIPVDDDAVAQQPVYLNLWDNIRPPLPQRQSSKGAPITSQGWVMPETLEGAIRSLYRSYEQNHVRYEKDLAGLGEPPPVMIIVCPNTVVSKLVYEWIAGWEVDQDGEKRLRPGNLSLLSNIEDGVWTTRQRTILVDSVALESGDPLGPDFKQAAAREIEAFKQEFRLRNPGADVEKINDADLLREAMNTIGKKGKLGEHIRCVVSVAMLTEGWDANTVTHILGVRPFRSQLLCEQVVGRGLRRRSYAANADGKFEPEYAEVYGVPFAFIPSDRATPPPQKDIRPAIRVYAVSERADLAIRWPKLDGYRVELPDETLIADFDEKSRLHVTQEFVALWVENQGVVGERLQIELADIRGARDQRIAYTIAKRLMEDEKYLAAADGVERPWLFPQVVEICRQWLKEWVTTDPDVSKGNLLLVQATSRAAEKVFGSIIRQLGNRAKVLMPVLRRFDPEGSTDDVDFVTRKVVMAPPPQKSHLTEVVLDGQRGNTWEEGLAEILEGDSRVHAYVKNERLGFTIPYVHEGRQHDYVPDFIVRLVPRDADDVERTLIVEVSGSRKSPGPTAAKAHTARHEWCAAVNNWGQYGRWGYVEATHPMQFREVLHDAIENLYADRPIIGLPD
ncbi:DEAD/DEAH box helicase family protein [Couchioplanes caeruleus]|uniref:BPTD_3080 family restriction endonuclease n=1 Tax=Couchioplanes caeruleus TaxID=56438 RepID=UPI00201C15C9|nr:DEAD/DEAH box helicase family protein [Couchioplanes caeruleus]UQU67545.1 DEAD/DEAH box helicase family protein [Couchioplanes caeruleus]